MFNLLIFEVIPFHLLLLKDGKLAATDQSTKLIHYISLLIYILSALLLYYSSHDLNMSFDSYQYLAAAQSFADSGTLLNADGSVYSNWGPMFPVILSFVADVDNYRAVNLVVYAMLFWLSHLLIVRMVDTPILRLLVSLWIAFSTPVLMQFNFLWSESIFIFLFLVQIIVFFRYRETNKMGWLILLIVLSAVSCLQRYAGLFIIPGFALLIIMDRGYKLRSFLISFVYGGLACLPVLVWMYSRYQSSGGGFSMFLTNLYASFFSNLYRSYYQDVFFSWFVPSSLTFELGHYYVLGTLILVILFRKQLKVPRFKFEIQSLLILSGVYFLFLNLIDYSAIIHPDMTFGGLSDFERYLSIIYIPVILLLFVWLSQKLPLIEHKTTRVVLLGLICLWSIYPISRSIKNTLDWKEYTSSAVVK
ncbi:hypothetical protein N6H18_04150 [Reichenbachiella agarivorans]|uniref:Dolichyl-phosphate-mannose-protein mannosyltransferase n=1 Tax=Reichenbachiella agarivorans TaxID=2979464 RepID=A0ABY6CT26_9BACT|nr:hypothetical protein [Reichenbachiella agarivorans]UXP33145.1 hypothetical protein N6H18_04150 [Reichenbachiella agarivorans]